MGRPVRIAVALALVALTAPAAAGVAGVEVRAAADGLRAGVGIADATWHVGAGAGQYSEKEPADPTATVDPHQHSLTQRDSYGVASRLTMRALVVEGTNGRRVALVKSDNYLAQDHLARRVGQLLGEAGSAITADDIVHSATHNHSSPYYATPSWGVWVFQDVADLRAFEFQARAMRDAILAAETALVPARMGATTVHHDVFKGNIAGRGVADDGTPFGYPEDFGDEGVVVLRFDDVSGATPRPLAVWSNYGQHPESLDDHDLITADFLGPLERFVEREVGAPLIFTQGDVGSAEGPYERDNVAQMPDGTWRAWAHTGHAQQERGARLLADAVVDAWHRIGAGDATVPLTRDVPVDLMTYWAPGPVSHPYPSVSNCRTGPTAEGDAGLVVTGLPDCDRGTVPDAPSPIEWESLQSHGIPLPGHYDAPGLFAVEENARLQLQAVRLGDVLLASCACEAQVDLILNLESRADKIQGNIWDGFPWDAHCDPADAGWQCPDPGKGTADRSQAVSDSAYRRMAAQIHNDASGWDDPAYALEANSEPADPAAIKGNFTKEELPAEYGYALVVGLGHTGDYNGYTVSYREYMSRDHYRKALTSYGPHTADYMVTRLVRMGGALKGGPPLELDPLSPVAEADEVRQEATSQVLGRLAGAAYDAWLAALPDDAGPVAPVEQPRAITRFQGASFAWRGGSNAVDNPVVRVERLADGTWVPYADQSGEVQTVVDMPVGPEGVVTTYSGGQEWVWRANFEAFDAAPARLGQVPDGTYRFVVDGRIRQSGATEAYHLESAPFAVTPWRGIKVEAVEVEGRDAVVRVAPVVYPRTYESVVRMIGDDKEPRICRTCSFRPWASTGSVRSVTVTVGRSGPDGELLAARSVPATLEAGRWVARGVVRAGETAIVAAGAVVDQWGETNGDAVAATR